MQYKYMFAIAKSFIISTFTMLCTDLLILWCKLIYKLNLYSVKIVAFDDKISNPSLLFYFKLLSLMYENQISLNLVNKICKCEKTLTIGNLLVDVDECCISHVKTGKKVEMLYKMIPTNI
jgi:hypothetical protein